MTTQLLEDMAHDCIVTLLNNPRLKVVDATFKRLYASHCEAVLWFSDGSSVMAEVDLGDDIPPVPAMLDAIRMLILENCQSVAEAFVRDLPAWGQTVH